MDIFWRLVLSHLLADFTLQTNWINQMKRKSVTGVVIHVFVHIITTFLILLPYLNTIWFKIMNYEIKGYTMLLIICFFHFIIDQTRVYIINKKIYKDNTISFVADQIFHFYFIFIFTPFKDIASGFYGEKYVMVLTFLVLVTHTTTVLIYYIEKDLNNIPFPNFDQKYFMIFERTVIWAFFLLKGWWWLIFWVAWIYQLNCFKTKKIIDITPLNFWMSVSISAIFGLISRYYYYL